MALGIPETFSLLQKEYIMKPSKIALCAAVALYIVNVAPAFAEHGTKGVPGPIAGMGLPFLIAAGAAGAYKLIRQRKEGHCQHDSAEQD
jgi:hypothetical protein